MARKNELTLKYDSDTLKNLSEETAARFSLDTEDVKGHNVYFVVFDGSFGYSCLVFKDGRIMPYAGDYALHHRDMYRSSLRKLYIDSLNHKLFTEDELTGPVETYSEYLVKIEYLINHYSYLRDHVSIFYNRACLSGSPEQKAEDARIERESAGKMYDPIGHGWYDDVEFVKRHMSLFNAVASAYEQKMTDYDFCFDAFRYEMFNHEYAINWQGNWDVLSMFGKIEYDHDGDDQNLTFYFDQLNFTSTQRRAYMDARSYVYAHSDY